MRSYNITFKEGDRFFEPVLSYMSSWLLYCIATRETYTPSDMPCKGRLRGFFIPQITFNFPNFLRKMRSQQKIDSLSFSVIQEQPPKIKGKMIPDRDVNRFWLQQMIGSSYEAVFDEITKKYHCKKRKDQKKKWSSLMEFFYHLRNGCFHGNRFYIESGNISTFNPPKWRSAEIKYDMNDSEVVNGFMGRADLIHFLYDVDQELNK